MFETYLTIRVFAAELRQIKCQSMNDRRKQLTHGVEQPADCAVSTATQHSELGNVFIELQPVHSQTL